jgi:hypothetical protein
MTDRTLSQPVGAVAGPRACLRRPGPAAGLCGAAAVRGAAQPLRQRVRHPAGHAGRAAAGRAAAGRAGRPAGSAAGRRLVRPLRGSVCWRRLAALLLALGFRGLFFPPCRAPTPCWPGARRCWPSPTWATACCRAAPGLGRPAGRRRQASARASCPGAKAWRWPACWWPACCRRWPALSVTTCIACWRWRSGRCGAAPRRAAAAQAGTPAEPGQPGCCRCARRPSAACWRCSCSTAWPARCRPRWCSSSSATGCRRRPSSRCSWPATSPPVR